jgi:hypothetical protein
VEVHGKANFTRRTITVINAFNRLGVTSRWKLPPEPQ